MAAEVATQPQTPTKSTPSKPKQLAKTPQKSSKKASSAASDAQSSAQFEAGKAQSDAGKTQSDAGTASEAQDEDDNDDELEEQDEQGEEDEQDEAAPEDETTEDAEQTKEQVGEKTEDSEKQAEDEAAKVAAEEKGEGETEEEKKEPEEPEEEKEPEETEEEKQKREAAEEEERQKAQAADDEEKQKKQDAEIANRISDLISSCLDKIKPTLKLISDTLNKADRDRQNDELDEEKLVDQVKPLIEQATNTLQETHGGIKALDPSGMLSKRAQAKTAERQATPEEYRLSDLLKELTEKVENTIDEAKRRIQDMPKAKKDLGPLLDVLRDPLFQILSAVGLLLNGVLGLLGNLLGGLGLGGIIDKITGALGLDKILKGMGFGKILGGKK